MTRRPNTWKSLWALTKFEKALAKKQKPFMVYESSAIYRFRPSVMACIYLGEYVYWQLMGRRKARCHSWWVS